MLFGTIANPQSAAVLLGALIAVSGLRWMQTGQGFWWLAAATALASVVAVTHSLPAGAFMVAIVAALLLRRSGWRLAGDWEPRWWQLGVLTAIVVAPVIVFGRSISARATLSNAELYAFAPLDSWRSVLTGALQEVSVLHSPWYPSGSLGGGEGTPLVQRLLRASVDGLPTWLTVAVFALVVVTARGWSCACTPIAVPMPRSRVPSMAPLPSDHTSCRPRPS